MTPSEADALRIRLVREIQREAVNRGPGSSARTRRAAAKLLAKVHPRWIALAAKADEATQ